MYKTGVKLAIYPHVRPNPGIKKWDDRFRTSVSRFIQQQKVYEAVLINTQGQVTEGSRSNIFYIDRYDRLITVPSKDILPGITRKYVMHIARDQDLDILEKTIALEDLGSLVSVFISGTSPKVLPVRQIDAHYFDTDHPILQMLMDQFEQLVQNNLTLL
jgi:branched-chain amino acid aminotransferase